MQVRKDEMTSNERMAAYFDGEEVDRLPAMPMVDSFGPRLAGYEMRYKRLSAEHQVEVQKACYDLLGLDGLSIEYGLHGIGQACGTVLNDPADRTPSIDKHVLESIEQVDRLDLDCVLRKNDPWIDMCMTACEMLVDQMGDVVGTSASLTGPLTAAASLLPMRDLLVATRKKPELARKLIRFSTDALKLVSDQFASLGVDIFICDPVASGDIINEKTYREWVLPYTQELAPVIHKHNVAMGYHICGNTNKITGAMLESGCDMLSVDAKVPLTFAKEMGGDKVPIIGNVDPMDVMMLGTPDEVRENVLRNIEDCVDSPCGYIVSTGCDLPVNTPLENVVAFMDAVREYGSVRIGQKGSAV
ncbi:methylcobalamin:coenzyme M methyltransferase [Slackia heliotrinireducens]|uniref:Uroporphyrinogen-III decarboxylase n=1 Tax=Slackia heliotrinireducens (strain ATCC 29202 / DSM 20476 / NCTC 11029 / RHS 1) TaxID=471855 RepID=C7N7G4_SLAHD|nr:uroporphyrinogen decarboxylase family protein [Slackia heliotrinireducens]ACV22849.1 uroporphyrinogen-III decarboxylase [Slackia heliotrinireducens DSM 20476]VEH01599.1 methylcobalamin:coenzyme M methyltransferase [Slackia heliotrinireducens]